MNARSVSHREPSRCSVMTQRGGMWREALEGAYIYRLILVVAIQKPIQHYKEIILQLKNKETKNLFFEVQWMDVKIKRKQKDISQVLAVVNGNPLQCSCVENPRDARAWWAAVCGVAQSWTRLKRLSSSSCSKQMHNKIIYQDRKNQGRNNFWREIEGSILNIWYLICLFDI